MGDWPVGVQDGNNVFVSSASMESVGLEQFGLNNAGLAVNVATNWLTANEARFVPFVVKAPMTAKLLWCFNGSAVSGNVDMGIYTKGGTKLVSIGSTVQAGTSTIQSFDITDTDLWPGVHYLGIVLDNATGRIRQGTLGAEVCRAVGMLKMATAFALPATATYAAVASSIGVPCVGLSARTLV